MSLTKATYSMIDSAPINVKDYGASPSASAAANTTAIQAALDLALTTGLPVKFNAGTYNHNGLTYTGGNLKLIGDSTVLSFAGLSTLDGFIVQSASGVAASNCDISGITFQNGFSALKIKGVLAIYSNISVTNCIFQNTTSGSLWFELCSDSIITGNEFSNSGDVGCYYSFSSNGIIADNIFRNCAGSGAISVGYLAEPLMPVARNIVIRDNNIYTDDDAVVANYLSGIVAVMCENVSIIGNSITNKGPLGAGKTIRSGIRIEEWTANNIFISDNTISNIDFDGIALGQGASTVAVRNVTISNNRIYKTLRHIAIERSFMVDIINNDFNFSFQSAITADDTCSSINIAQNTFVDSGQQATFGSTAAIELNSPVSSIMNNSFIDGQGGGYLFNVTDPAPTYSVNGSGLISLYSSAVLQGTVATAGLDWFAVKEAVNLIGNWELNVFSVTNQTQPVDAIRRTGFRWSDNVVQYTAPNFLVTPEPYGYVLLNSFATNCKVLGNSYSTNANGFPFHHRAGSFFEYTPTDTLKDLNETGGGRLFNAAAIPVAGSWLLGDIINNETPAVGQPKGWICTVAGTPGTWVSLGNL
jgi:parallel beta-helix repeat protein